MDGLLDKLAVEAAGLFVDEEVLDMFWRSAER